MLPNHENRDIGASGRRQAIQQINRRSLNSNSAELVTLSGPISKFAGRVRRQPVARETRSTRSPGRSGPSPSRATYPLLAGALSSPGTSPSRRSSELSSSSVDTWRGSGASRALASRPIAIIPKHRGCRCICSLSRACRRARLASLARAVGKQKDTRRSGEVCGEPAALRELPLLDG